MKAFYREAADESGGIKGNENNNSGKQKGKSCYWVKEDHDCAQ